MIEQLRRGVRTRVAVAGCALVATVGIAAFASASESDPGGSSATVRASQSSQDVNPSAAIALLELRQSQGIEIDQSAMRSVPAPDGKAPWVVAPTRAGGQCAYAAETIFCGVNREQVEAGRAAVTTYPPDKILSVDHATGTGTVQPSDGTGVRSGIAPERATEVVVLDDNNQVFRREAVKRGVYKVDVPAQGTDAHVEFKDTAGKKIASRPAAGS